MMTELLIAQLLLLAYYLGYKVFLSKSTFFRLNRITLLSIPLIALLIPWIQISTSLIPTYTLPVFLVDQTIVPLSDQPINVEFPLLTIIYLVGLSISAMLLLFRLLKLRRFLNSLEFEKKGSIEIARQSFVSSFSFFNRVCVNENGNVESIIEHESVHVRMNHSLDTVVMEILSCFFWFNPLIYMIKRDLKDVHEYEVDQELKSENGEAFQFDWDLEQHLSFQGSLTNQYSSKSRIMKRINMLKSKRGNTTNRLSYALFALLLTGTGYLTSCSEVQDAENPPAPPPPPTENAEATQSIPTYPGGIDAMMAFLTDEIKYPESAKEDGISGRVMVQFNVAKDGSLKDVKVVQSVHPDLDAEALRAVKAMPKWEPGTKSGKVVQMQMMLPVMFSLPKEETSFMIIGVEKQKYAFTMNLASPFNLS